MPRPEADTSVSLERLGAAAYDAADALSSNFSRESELAAAADGRSARQNRRSLGFWTSIEAYKQLHHLAVDSDVTAGQLLNEALNLLFSARGLPASAFVPAGDDNIAST